MKIKPEHAYKMTYFSLANQSISVRNANPSSMEWISRGAAPGHIQEGEMHSWPCSSPGALETRRQQPSFAHSWGWGGGKSPLEWDASVFAFCFCSDLQGRTQVPQLCCVQESTACPVFIKRILTKSDIGLQEIHFNTLNKSFLSLQRAQELEAHFAFWCYINLVWSGGYGDT